MGVTGLVRRRGQVEIFGDQARNGDVRPELKPHQRQAAGTLSGGQQQMVAAPWLLVDPEGLGGILATGVAWLRARAGRPRSAES